MYLTYLTYSHSTLTSCISQLIPQNGLTTMRSQVCYFLLELVLRRIHRFPESASSNLCSGSRMPDLSARTARGSLNLTLKTDSLIGIRQRHSTNRVEAGWGLFKTPTAINSLAFDGQIFHLDFPSPPPPPPSQLANHLKAVSSTNHLQICTGAEASMRVVAHISWTFRKAGNDEININLEKLRFYTIKMAFPLVQQNFEKMKE